MVTGRKDQLDQVVQKILSAGDARADPQLRRHRLSRRGLQLRPARHQRRSRRHPVRPDGQRGLPGLQQDHRRLGARPGQISTLWTGFGGACETGGYGDPVVLYDQLANRWLISQFAGTGGIPITDECIAVSTTQRCHRQLQPLRLPPGQQLLRLSAPRRLARRLLHEHERLQRGGHGLPGAAAVRLQPRGHARRHAGHLCRTGAPARRPRRSDPARPTWTARPCRPPARPNSFVRFPGGGAYTVYHFHVDFATPANSTLTPLPARRRPASPALPDHARLRARAGDHGRQAGRHRRPADVPPGLSQLRRPRGARRQLHRQFRRRGRHPLV